MDGRQLSGQNGGSTGTLSSGGRVEVMKRNGVLSEVGEIGELDGFSDDGTNRE